jgi:hypothetical protein
MNTKEADRVSDREFTPPYARYLAPLIRPSPNFDLFFVESLRQRAVRRLQLHPMRQRTHTQARRIPFDKLAGQAENRRLFVPAAIR